MARKLNQNVGQNATVDVEVMDWCRKLCKHLALMQAAIEKPRDYLARLLSEATFSGSDDPRPLARAPKPTHRNLLEVLSAIETMSDGLEGGQIDTLWGLMYDMRQALAYCDKTENAPSVASVGPSQQGLF